MLEEKSAEAEEMQKPKRKIGAIKLIGILLGLVILILIIAQIFNASFYQMVVNVVGEENVVGVNPLAEKLDFGDLSRNNGMTRYITLKSDGNFASYILVWKFGAISPLVKTDKKFFTLKPQEEVKLAFEIHVPPSAEVKQYKGRVIIFKFPKFF